MMNPQKKQKFHCMLVGALAGAAVTLVLGCYCGNPPPAPPPAPVCADAAAPPPVVTPPPVEDAGCATPDAAPLPPPPPFDAGPSCGTHPWANAPQCCTKDCNNKK